MSCFDTLISLHNVYHYNETLQRVWEADLIYERYALRAIWQRKLMFERLHRLIKYVLMTGDVNMSYVFKSFRKFRSQSFGQKNRKKAAEQRRAAHDDQGRHAFDSSLEFKRHFKIL